jgi:hypothetical protein
MTIRPLIIADPEGGSTRRPSVWVVIGHANYS